MIFCTHLKKDLDSLDRSGDEGSGDGTEEAGESELGVGQGRGAALGSHAVDNLLAHGVTLRARKAEQSGNGQLRINKAGAQRRLQLTQKETANMGVTPASGGPIPR